MCDSKRCIFQNCKGNQTLIILASVKIKTFSLVDTCKLYLVSFEKITTALLISNDVCNVGIQS